jgi:hypothetical protein
MRQNLMDADRLLPSVLRSTSDTEHFLIHHDIWFDLIIFACETTGINVDEILIVQLFISHFNMGARA